MRVKRKQSWKKWRQKLSKWIIDLWKQFLSRISEYRTDKLQSDVPTAKAEEDSEKVKEEVTPNEQKTESNGTTSAGDNEEKCDTKDTTAIDELSSNAVSEQQTQNNNGKSNSNNNKKGKKCAKGKPEVTAGEEQSEVEA